LITSTRMYTALRVARHVDYRLVSTKIHSSNVRRSLRSRKILTSYFGFQGHSRSSMLVPPESSSAVLVMIRSKSVSICNCFYAIRANSGKITILGVHLFDALVRGGISSPSGTNFLKKLETLDYHTVKTRSLYLTWAWIGTGFRQTDGRTDRDRIAIANTRLALRAVARKQILWSWRWRWYGSRSLNAKVKGKVRLYYSALYSLA